MSAITTAQFNERLLPIETATASARQRLDEVKEEMKTFSTKCEKSDEIVNKLMTQIATKDGEFLSLMEKFSAIEVRMENIEAELKDGNPSGGDGYSRKPEAEF